MSGRPTAASSPAASHADADADERWKAGRSLGALRAAAGLTPGQVAAEARTSPTYLAKVERGTAVASRLFLGRVTAVIASRFRQPRELSYGQPGTGAGGRCERHVGDAFPPRCYDCAALSSEGTA